MTPSARRFATGLAAIVGAALAVRVAWVLWAAREPVGFHDPTFYLFYARQMAEGIGYQVAPGEPTAYYPPGYSLAITPLVWLHRHLPLPGSEATLVGLFDAAVGAAGVGLIGLLGRRLAGAAAGLVAAGLVALYPNLVIHSAALLTETVFVTLLVAALLLVIAARGWRSMLGAGVVLGAATLVRPAVLPLFLLLPLLAWPGTSRRVALQRTAVLLAGTAAVILPWTVRNAVTMGEVVLISTNTGDNLCIGHHPGARGGFAMPDWCFANFHTGDRPEFEIRRDRTLARRGLSWALEHPREEVWLVAQRARYTFRHDHDGVHAVESYGDDAFLTPGQRLALQRLSDIYYVALGAAALAGLPLLLRRGGPGGRLVLLAAAAILISPLVTFGDARFKLPAMALAAIPAAMAVVWAARSLRRRPREPRSGPAQRRRRATTGASRPVPASSGPSAARCSW